MIRSVFFSTSRLDSFLIIISVLLPMSVVMENTRKIIFCGIYKYKSQPTKNMLSSICHILWVGYNLTSVQTLYTSDKASKTS